MMQLIVAFQNFANAPENAIYYSPLLCSTLMLQLCVSVNAITKWHLPFFLAVSGGVTGNTVEVEVVEGAGISGKVR